MTEEKIRLDGEISAKGKEKLKSNLKKDIKEGKILELPLGEKNDN